MILQIKHTLFCIILITVAVACKNRQEIDIIYDKVESLINEYPDSAYNILCGLDSTEIKNEAYQMRHTLLSVCAKNKLYIELPSDKDFIKVVEYFDAVGNSNEKMLAHYLLGCIYRDTNEAPVALTCYNDAIAFADTTNTGCDFSTLFRIYGQMALIYNKQYMPEEEIAALQKSSKYALECRDTFCYVKGIELMVAPYYQIGDTDKVFEITDSCYNLYKKFGMPQAAASVYPKAIFAYIKKRQYSKADSLMKIFENQSGLFDKDGNIEAGREDYYYDKGIFLLGVNKYNDAEQYFRKLLLSNRQLLAFDGLLKTYCKSRNVDSLTKYAILWENKANETIQKQQSEAIIQARSLYNYNRLKNIAIDEAAAAKEAQHLMLLIATFSIIIILMISIWYRKKNNERKRKLGLLQNNLFNTSKDLQEAKEELQVINSVKDKRLNELQAKKQTEIEKLTQRVVLLEAEFGKLQDKEQNTALMESDIVLKFRKNTIPQPKSKQDSLAITYEDWNVLYEQIRLCLPTFYNFLLSNQELTPQEYKVCLLTRLYFTNKEIAIILGTGTQNIPNAKKRANFKLFNENTASTLQENLYGITPKHNS